MNNEEKILNVLDNLSNKVDSIQSQVQENTQILKALEHSSQEHKALLDQLNHRVASVEGKIDTISKDLTMVEAVAGKNMTDIAFLKGVK